MHKNALKTVFLDTVPVMTGYLFLGISFGILLQEAGYGLPWAFSMALFMYAGSAQFLSVSLLANHASILSSAIAVFLLNARHIFYGISLIDAYKDTGKKKPYLIFALTDETYSLNCNGAPEDLADKSLYFFLVSLFNHSYWVTGSVLGAALESFLPFSTEGIDFSLTALFVTVFVEQWKSTHDHIPALLGLGASLLCLAVFGPGNFLIPAMFLITAALALYRKKGGDRHV